MTWEEADFEDCLEKIKYTDKIQRKDFLESGKFPIISQEQEYINGYWNDSKDLFKIKKPVVIFGDHTQVLKYIDFDFVLGAEGVKILQPINKLEGKFFYYYLMSAELKNLGYARHYKLLKEKIVPLPPLSEQKRIVAILDEAFEKTAKAKDIAEKNLKKAKEIFESYLQSVFENKGEGWEEKTLGEVCEKITQGPNPKYDSKEEDKYRVLKTKDLYDNIIYYEKADKISENVFKSCQSSELKNGDVLLAIVGQGSINKCNVFENQTNKKFIFTRALGLIRPNDTKLHPYYLNFFLQSSKGKQIVNLGINGTSGQQVITTTYIKEIRIPLPPINEQVKLIKSFNTLSQETKKLETIYEKKLADLEELKKSILQKAFRGELSGVSS